jgi:hypothetical protein
MSVDELAEYGMERMDDDDIDAFLSTQRTGVLGLPTETNPYLLPLTFGYDDGESRLLFTFVLGATSRKRDLTERAEQATFLVYSVDSMFVWESVMLSGSISELPESDWKTAMDALSDAWRPEIFEEADLSGGVAIYQFVIEDRSGIKYASLPPRFDL